MIDLGIKFALFKNFGDELGNACVVVNDADAECVRLSTTSTNKGKGLRIRCDEGSFVLASVNCRFSEPLDPYLPFIDEVLSLADSIPAINGMDANATSPTG